MAELNLDNNVEEIIRKEKELSDFFIESLPGVFFLFDEEGNYLRWNKNFETASGYTESEIAQMHHLDFIHEKDKQVIIDAVNNVFATGYAETHADVITKNGSTIPFFFKARAINYEEKKCLLGTGIDVSLQLQAQLEIKKSEEKYRSLFEQASDAIMVTDLEGNFEDVNESMCKMFGYSREELIGNNVNMLIDPEQLKVRPMTYELLVAGHHVFSNRRMVHKDGRIIEVEANVKRITANNLLAITRDITERIQVENELAESENRLRIIFEAEPECIKLLDCNCNLIDMNPAGLALIDADNSNQVIGQNVIQLVNENYREPFQNLNKEVFNGHSKKLEFEITSLKGTHRWMEMHAVPLRNKEGNIICSLSISRDITERRKAEEIIRMSEQKYKLLFNKNPLPMLMLSIPDMKFIDVNDASLLQYGYTREEFLKMSVKNILPKDDLKKLNTVSDLKQEGINNMGIWRHMKKDGTIFNVEIITQLTIYNNDPVWLSLALNVTEKLLAEENLKQSNEQLRKISSHLENIREVERANISREIHDELGQQLTGLKMDTSWLIKRIEPENKIIHERLAGMISLIDDTVKKVRRISSELRPGILDDLGLIDALQWQSNEFEKRTGITCYFHTSLSDFPFDKSLSTGLFRVYQETLTNIARHAQASEVNTTLEKNDESILMHVRDNGTGFDESVIRKKQTLGLLGMKERAIMFGGKLHVTSSPGNGTSISLEVPLRIPQTKKEAIV
jgi:PAS domain S-box-containing protein